MWYPFGWFWLWLAFLIVFFFLPLGYGWGYRGWGPPYRRRIPAQGPEHLADSDVGWGVVGIVMWAALAIAVVWFIVAFTF